MIIALIMLLVIPVGAIEITAPAAPDAVQDLMPAEKESFAQGLLTVLKASLSNVAPDLYAASGCCLSVIAIVLLASIFNTIPGSSTRVVRLVTTLSLTLLLLGQANTMVHLCAETVTQISDYGKLLLPAITAALAAQGGAGGATALYAGTAVFDTILTSIIGKLMVPLVYVFLALAVANSATGENLMKKMRDLVKWLITSSLKTILYVFTGYLSITGVIAGTADAAAVKAAKLTISGAVPVVGGILSDASEAVIVGAGVVKNAVGVYGLLAVAALFLSPFLRMGIQYLLLKFSGALCEVFAVKEASDLIEDFSSAMGFLLGMTGTISFLMLISTICFMRGMG